MTDASGRGYRRMGMGGATKVNELDRADGRPRVVNF